jgi:AsmA protein
MTGLLVAALILGLILIVGGAALFLLLPILLALGGIVVLIALLAVAAVLLLPNFITLDQFKPQILEQFSKATGREIAIGGPIGFTVWPVLGLQLSDISVGNPEGAADPIMLSAKGLGVGVSLKSLLDHKLDIQKIYLSGAQINLSQSAKGKANWEFTPKDKKDTTAPAEGEGNAKANDFQIKDINIQSVEISDTDISFARPGVAELELSKIQVAFAMPGLDKPAKLQGQFGYNSQTVKFDAELAKPRAMSKGESTPLAAHISIGSDKITYTGQLSGVKTNGRLEVKVTELAQLLALASGNKPSLPVKTLSLQSDISASPLAADFKNLAVKLDDISLNGKAALAFGAGRPSFELDADVSALDLDKLMPTPAPATPETAPVTASAAAPDLSSLKSVNIEAGLRLAGVTIKRLQLGATTAKLTVREGKLVTQLSPASFYGGTLAGKLELNANDKRFNSAVTLDGVNIEPVLTVLQGASRLAGKGEFTANISGVLGAGDALQRSLSGEGKFALRDGAIKGVNVAALIRKAKSMIGQKTDEAEGANQTDFSELTGSYTISKGVLKNEDLKLLSPLIRVTGRGTFDIPPQAVNYRVDSALVADLSGQGGVFERKGLVVPVNVTGKLGALSYSPDLKGLVLGNIGSAGQVGDALKNLNSKEGKRELRNNLKDLLGLPKKTETAPTPAPAESVAPAAPLPAEKQAKPADLLKDLLGGR